MMSKKKRNESLAKDIRNWLLQNDMWIDTTIYFNGKAFSTNDRQGNFYYNDPEHLVVLEDMNPEDCFEYVNPDHILSMSFEGPLYDLLNGYWVGGMKLEKEFDEIFKKYGLMYELGNAWNLSCYKL